MTPKLAPRRTPSALVPSLLGRGLPDRLRSTTVALTGVVAAACLAVIGLTLQYGLPLASSGPIHQPVEAEVGSARALVEPEPEPRRGSRAVSRRSVSERPARVSPSPPNDAPAPAVAPPLDTSAGSDRGDGDGKRKPPAAAPPKPSPAPTPAPVEEPVATPSGELPEPEPEEPVEEPAAVPGKGHAYGKGGGVGPEGTGPPGLAGR